MPAVGRRYTYRGTTQHPKAAPSLGSLSDSHKPPRKISVSKQLLRVQGPRGPLGVALHHPSSSSAEFLQHPSTSALCFKVQPCCFHKFCLTWQPFIKTSMCSCWSSCISKATPFIHCQPLTVHFRQPDRLSNMHLRFCYTEEHRTPPTLWYAVGRQTQPDQKKKKNCSQAMGKFGFPIELDTSSTRRKCSPGTKCVLPNAPSTFANLKNSFLNHF